MSLKTETEAFERLIGNVDQAFLNGTFGLANAMQIVPDIQTVASLFNTPEPDLIRRFIAQPTDEWKEEGLTDEQVAVPGTTDKVARKRS